nr:hypothetical protein [Tanacetum cinerariifolium]
MATTTNGRRESSTNATRRILIEEEDYGDYMPKYTGVQDPIAANMWIDKMEQFFDTIECADGDKLVYAVSMLRSGAKTWWDKIKDTSELTKMTWSRLKEVFKEEFSTLRMEMELVEKYATIKQGRNESGLNANIKDFIPDKDLISWEKMLAAALLIEKENNRRLEEMNALNKKMGRERIILTEKALESSIIHSHKLPLSDRRRWTTRLHNSESSQSTKLDRMGLLHAQLKVRPTGGVEVGAECVAAEDTWVSGWKVGQRLQTKQDGLESNRNNLGKVSLRGDPPSQVSSQNRVLQPSPIFFLNIE